MLIKFSRQIFAVFPLLLLFTVSVLASDKKGIGLADLKGAERVKILNVKWYYTWKPYPIEGINEEEIEFVPMIWGGKRLEEHLEAIRKKGFVKVLLYLNEPDKEDQANMSVEEALYYLPEVRKYTERLGSPACAGGIKPWCQRFLEEAKKMNIEIDFIAVHIYGPPDPEKFLKRIDEIYQRYKKPIWITEFAVADWEAKKEGRENRYSEKEVLEFMKKVLPELEKRPYVERYAWFGARKNCQKLPQIKPSCLFNEDGSLTELGKFYSKFKWN